MAKERLFFVVDWADDIVLFKGSMKDCNKVVNQSYAGLDITVHKHLTSGMKANWNKKLWNTVI